MDDMLYEYKQWRKVFQGMLDDGHTGSLDCGEKAVREDFSSFAGLNETISFQDMYNLENLLDIEK